MKLFQSLCKITGWSESILCYSSGISEDFRGGEAYPMNCFMDINVSIGRGRPWANPPPITDYKVSWRLRQCGNLRPWVDRLSFHPFRILWWCRHSCFLRRCEDGCLSSTFLFKQGVQLPVPWCYTRIDPWLCDSCPFSIQIRFERYKEDAKPFSIS